ncbi:tryptophan 2,3-dioxygenase [Nocardia alni]|uniref:tryptophan 2,3-dioxygenase n=1 Tax=Nocardia alni TaxID=2815723 RepID=UPI0020B3751F|nr:tryptophan 2,3-dioxygenase family protein [Nocardia alni]
MTKVVPGAEPDGKAMGRKGIDEKAGLVSAGGLDTAAGQAHALTYGGYLRLDDLLDVQRPLSRPERHDEMLFIIQHQTTELWFKLILHETVAARAAFDADDIAGALKCLARVKRIMETLTEQWAVLATLTPTEYGQFRGFLGNSSGFQSYQYRAVEFIFGGKNARMLEMFEDEQAARALLGGLLAEPSLYDAFWRCVARLGYAVPESAAAREVAQPYALNPELLPLIRTVYENNREHWVVYEAFEELVDLEESFQLWRFRHLRTVMRIIGAKPGTGGSSGVGYLRNALDRTFFPELFAVRAEIGEVAVGQ